MTLPIDKPKLVKALKAYYRKKQGAPIPNDSYIVEAIMVIVNALAKKEKYRRNPYIEDMRSEATILMIQAVVRRKMEASQRAFVYLNIVCRHAFEHTMAIEGGAMAVVQNEIMAQLSIGSKRAREAFTLHSETTKSARDAYFQRKHRRGKKK